MDHAHLAPKHHLKKVPVPPIPNKNYFFKACRDSDGNATFKALNIAANQEVDNEDYIAKFNVHLNMEYEEFIKNPLNRIHISEKLNQFFTKRNRSGIVMSSISSGSTVVSWFNKELAVETCLKDEINDINRMMSYDNNDSLTQDFRDAFQPEFDATNVDVIFLGVCVPADDVLVTFIVPTIIIITMLFIAILIACILSRKRRKGKMTRINNRTFVSKGIPIIFAEELDDKPEPPKNPIIMKDEKPPKQPPEYTRPGMSSTPRPDQPLLADDEASPYQPPPPFSTSSGGRSNRPKATPTYRKPPPYVPP